MTAPNTLTLDLSAFASAVADQMDTGRQSKVMSVQEVAKELGLAPSTVQQRCRDGELPAFKHGKFWIISRARFNAWVDGKEAQ